MSFEAVKHEHLISHYDEALKNQNLTAQDRELLETMRSNAAHHLNFYRSELSEINADPALGRDAPIDDGAIDVKQSKAFVPRRRE